MAISAVNPYLMFNGTAAQALAFYQKALAAQLEEPISWYKDMPGGAPGLEDRVLHATFKLGEAVMMVSDTTPDRAVPLEGNVMVAAHFESVESLEAAYAAMSDGAEINMPICDTFWGARFAMLKDKFAIGWMLSYTYPAGAKG